MAELELNAEQRQAAETGDGPLLIVAGPGTGKTKTLTARIAHLMVTARTPPADILGLTFTNKAAREMRERLEMLLGVSTRLPRITTFHALGYDLLQQADVPVKLAAESEALEIVRSLTKPATLKGLTVRELRLIIAQAKASLDSSADETTRQLVAAYDRVLHSRGLIDFDDVLQQSLVLLQRHPPSTPKYRYVLVDEFQDTTDLQYELVKLLIRGKNIFAIGDPNQSIYGFRGATADMFTRFRDDYPTVKDITLRINYRSGRSITRLARAIFPNAVHAQAARPECGLVRTIQTLHEYSEAAYVVSSIERGIGGSDLLSATSEAVVRQPRDYAVLYRTRRAARVLHKLCQESGLPCQVVGEGSPYASPTIQSLIAALRYLRNPIAQVSVAAPLQERQLAALARKVVVADDTTVSDLATRLAHMLDLTSDQAVPQFLSTLVQFGAGYEGLGRCLAYLDELSEREFYDPAVNAVTLSTIHAAKGLEFDHVFVCAAEEGVLPKACAEGTIDLEEERRLFYVAVTRARDTLEILYTKSRAGQTALPSRFINDIEAAVLPRTNDPMLVRDERRLVKRQQKRAQGSLF